MALNTLHDVVICALQKKKNKGMIVKASVNNVSHIRCESEKKKKKEHIQKHNKILVSRLLAIT